MDIKNKRVVITGATSGIGQHILKEFAKVEGVEIVACGRKIENLPTGSNIFPFKADISKSDEVDALFDFSIAKMGGIDIFFANAGFAYYERFSSDSWQHIDNLFSTNITSPIYSLGKMIQINRGREFMVVMTCSVIGKLPFPGYSLYTATKFALDGFNSAMQYEMPSNGRLMMVYPVATRTEFFDRASVNTNMPHPYQSTKDVVSAILKGIKKNKQRVFPYPLIVPILYIANIFPFLLKIYFKIQQRKLKHRGF